MRSSRQGTSTIPADLSSLQQLLATFSSSHIDLASILQALVPVSTCQWNGYVITTEPTLPTTTREMSIGHIKLWEILQRPRLA